MISSNNLGMCTHTRHIHTHIYTTPPKKMEREKTSQQSRESTRWTAHNTPHPRQGPGNMGAYHTSHAIRLSHANPSPVSNRLTKVHS